jgi:hypothetical protein
MAVSRVKTSSILQGFPKSRSLLAGNAAYDPAATFFIQRITATGGETSLSFTSIPSNYKHLQIRSLTKTTNTTNAGANIMLRFNSDSSSSYALHRLSGDGSTASASATAPSTDGINLSDFAQRSSTQLANIYAAGIIDIHDYSSTTKNKTVRSMYGNDSNQTGAGLWLIYLYSGLWINTSAISTVTFSIASGTSFAAGTTFGLYGMVG